ncbi:MAG: FtsX-like permease family protein [Pseudomonadota bacterium]
MSWGRIWTIARRDLNGRFRGLRLLFICLFLGVATLATIGSLTTSITSELSQRGQEILGGDVEIAISQRYASEEERVAFDSAGSVSETNRMRAMARAVGDDAQTDSGPSRVLVELKGVDALYPHYGAVLFADGSTLDAPLDNQSVVVGQGLIDRLNLGIGDRLQFGTAQFTITHIVTEEPDRIGEGFTLGPVALVSLDGLARTGLVQPGSLYETKYRIKTPAGANPAAVAENLTAQFPTAGWEVKDREEGAPGTTRFIERLGQFLGLVGLTALIVAGIGVGNGVSSYLAGKRGSIATFKVLGAETGDIARIYLLQLAAVAALAIVTGLLLGALVPPLIIAALGDVLPVSPGISLHPVPLLAAALYGLLIAIIFALPPLARARYVPAAGLFRDLVDGQRRFDPLTVVLVMIAFAAIVALAMLTAREPLFSAGFLGASLAMLLLLALLGVAIRWIAARLPRPRQPLVRLAMAGLHRPGAQTGALVVALGLGLTLFVILAAIQTSLTGEITRSVPQRAPSLFALDIPVDREAELRERVAIVDADAEVATVPALRGRITAYGDTRVADLEELPEGAWYLRGERGLTYAAELPQGSELIDGQWWPLLYNGPPLVSIDEEMAGVLGLEVGDTLSVSLLGREMTAEIASLRKINWETLGFNYTMVFSPNALRDAPHNLAATVSLSDPGNDLLERKASNVILELFPSATVIEVSEIIGEVRTILNQMATAITAAAAITILSGLAVLIGAIAASRQARTYDSVILKTLGATRRQILLVQAMEYGLLSLILALVALGLGYAASWYVMTQIFQFGFAPDWTIVMLTLGGGALLTLVVGLVGALPVLAAKPAQALRHL